MCNCGCNTCETKGPLLTEGKVKSLLSEGLQYHIDKQIPLFETVYRIGSDKHLALIKEARKMYSRNVIDLCEEDEALIKTHLGEFALYEGESVPLDLPMLEQTYSGFLRNPEDPDSEKFEPTGSVAQFKEDLRALFGKFKGDLKNPEFIKGVAQIMVNWKSLLRSQLDEQKEYTKGDFEQMASREFKPGTATDSEIVALARKAFLDYKFGKGFKHHFPKTFNISEAKVNYDFSEKELIKVIKLLKNHAGTEIGVIDAFEKALGRKLTDDEIREFKLNEAKKKKKKDPPIGKPMRDTSGGKAYKVYVKDPKTGNVKTVRFGSGGLRAKINDRKARQAFAKRHKCSTRNDKTKASYWSCRLPRYAKLLGLKSSFSGFW